VDGHLLHAKAATGAGRRRSRRPLQQPEERCQKSGVVPRTYLSADTPLQCSRAPVPCNAGHGGEQYCTLSLVAPLLSRLLTKNLMATDTDTPVVHHFKAAAWKNLSDRYPSPTLKSIFHQAAYLDPRFKSFRFVKDEEARNALLRQTVSEVEQAVITLSAESPTAAAEVVVAEPPAKRRRKGECDLKQFLQDSDDDDECDVTIASGLQGLANELQAYGHELVKGGEESPVQYWKAAKSRYPKLARLATATWRFWLRVCRVNGYSAPPGWL
jgi:hypothetical protein